MHFWLMLRRGSCFSKEGKRKAGTATLRNERALVVSYGEGWRWCYALRWDSACPCLHTWRRFSGAAVVAVGKAWAATAAAAAQNICATAKYIEQHRSFPCPSGQGTNNHAHRGRHSITFSRASARFGSTCEKEGWPRKDLARLRQTSPYDESDMVRSATLQSISACVLAAWPYVGRLWGPTMRRKGFLYAQMAWNGGSVLQKSWKWGCVLHMTASGEKLRASLGEPALRCSKGCFCSSKLWTRRRGPR